MLDDNQLEIELSEEELEELMLDLPRILRELVQDDIENRLIYSNENSNTRLI